MKKLTAVALVIVMMLTLAVCTFAKDPVISPEKPGSEYKLTVIATEGGEAWYVKNPDGSYTIYAKPDKDHSFTKWTTEGDFEIVDGKIGDKTLTIVLKSDVTFTAYFDGNKPVKPWDEENSPTTGNAYIAVAVVAAVSLFGCAYAVKRSYNV